MMVTVRMRRGSWESGAAVGLCVDTLGSSTTGSPPPPPRPAPGHLSMYNVHCTATKPVPTMEVKMYLYIDIRYIFTIDKDF